MKMVRTPGFRKNLQGRRFHATSFFFTHNIAYNIRTLFKSQIYLAVQKI